MPTHRRPATEPAIARPEELSLPEFSNFVGSIDPDPDLDHRAEELALALDALMTERERGLALRRTHASLTASLPTATGADRIRLLGELLVLDADRATIPASIAAATRRHALARLEFLHRIKGLAEAEAGRLVAETNAPIAAIDRLSLAVFTAQGYTGFPRPDQVDDATATLSAARATVAPARERHRQAKEVAAMARGIVESAYGDSVSGFSRSDRATLPWETVADRTGELAGERARREIAKPLELVA